MERSGERRITVDELREQPLVASAPLRLSLAGGGTDLPAHYTTHGASLLTVALSWRLSVEVRAEEGHHDSPNDLVRLFVERAPIPLRVDVRTPVSLGAGLGGSGAVAVCLVAALRRLHGDGADDPLDLALEAYRWEGKLLGRPVGFQDPVACALGSCVEMDARPDGRIAAARLDDLATNMDSMMRDSIVLAETGTRRSADSLLHSLAAGLRGSAAEEAVQGLARTGDMKAAIAARDGARLGEILRRHWQSKLSLNPGATTPAVDEALEAAIDAGATGGKLVGAGGGGFVMVAGPSHARTSVIEALEGRGLRPVPVGISTDGVRVEREAARPLP